MLIIPEPKKQQRRIKVTTSSETPPPVELSIASVSVGDFDGPEGHLVVRFAVPAGASLIEPADANPEQWTVVYSGTLYQGSDFEFDGGSDLTIYFNDYGFDPGPNRLNYAADPSDISDTAGQWLGAVSGYLI